MSEARFRGYFENSLVGMAVASPQNVCVECNDRLCEILGYSRAELQQKTMTELTHPADLSLTIESFDRLLRGQVESYVLEKRYLRKDGTIVHAEVSIRGMRKPDGSLDHVLGIIHDITARKQAEAALRDSELRLRLAVSAANIGLWDWDIVTGALYYSPEWKLQLGYADHEIPSTFAEWEKRLHPLDRVSAKQRVEAYLASTEGQYRSEFRLLHKDGSYRWIYAHGDTLRDPAGKPRRMLGCHVDLTDTKHAESTLRSNEARLQEAERIAHLGYLDLDLATHQITWSDQIYRMANVRREDFSPTLESTLAFVHPEDRHAVKESINRAIRAGTGLYLENRIQRLGGEVLYVEANAELIRDAMGKPLRLMGTVLDITERKKAEIALRESEQRFASVFKNSPVGIALTRISDNRLLDVNDSYAAMHGYRRTELIGRTPIEAGLWVDLQARERMVEKIRAEGRCLNQVIQYGKKNKDTGYLLLSAERIVVAGQECILGLAHDISERMRAEAALQTLSHRLRHAQDEEQRRIARELHDSTAQRLAAVMMNLSMLEDHLPAGDAVAQKLHVESLNLVEQCSREVRTLSYLLHPPLLEQLGLLAALRAYTDGFAKRSGIAVEIFAPDTLPRFSHPIELALFRVAQEGLGNVYRHSGSKQALISLRLSQNSLTLELSDEGHGMSPDVLKAIQQGFLTTGVGIAGMKERLDELGGRLEIESDAEGTTLRATVPIAMAML